LEPRRLFPAQACPGLSGVAVTIAALTCPLSALMVQETVVVALYPTSGLTCAWQLPTVCLEAASTMLNMIVEGARALSFPPRFLSSAETTQVDVHFDVSTDTTV